ncbi:hypothetical protein LZK77_16365 [Rhizobium leguminosarum]|nr:hypothetical protein LZK77_16365 [Rhizobium leguminosarum]
MSLTRGCPPRSGRRSKRSQIKNVSFATGFWTPPQFREHNDFFEIAKIKGFDLDFGREDEDAPLDLQRLYLTPETRERLEGTSDFTLQELAGYCPVQGEGEFDGQPVKPTGVSNPAAMKAEPVNHDGGMKKSGPGETGFEAGYMSDEDAVCCILKAVEVYRSSDRAALSRDILTSSERY